jgi:serine/threonine-protein kinase
MSTQDTQKLIETAKQMEARGQIEPALEAYKRAGAVEEAARVLLNTKREDEAGGLLLHSLRLLVVQGKVDQRAVDALPAEGKRRLLKAAICFSRGKNTELAIDIMVMLGEVPRAVEFLTKTGDTVRAQQLQADFRKKSSSNQFAPAMAASTTSSRALGVMNLDGAKRLEADGKFQLAMEAYIQLRQLGSAARMARMLKLPEQAAKLFSDGAMPYESALCYLELGDTGKALDQFCRVPRDDARYREASMQAIKMASGLNALDFVLENFLSTFLRQPPTSNREAEAFYELGRLYQRHDFVENARDAFGKLLEVAPNYKDARDRVEQIDRDARGSAMVYDKILREEQAFRSGESDLKRAGYFERNLPDLPELPGLPSLPATPSPMARPSANVAAVAAPALPPTGARQAEAGPTNDFPVVRQETPGVAAPITPPADWKGLVEGSMLGARYKLEKKLGEGGMASVFRAHDLELDERVAIKVFTQTVEDENMVARFKQELTLSRKLSHPNIIRLYDIGTFLGYRFISMELLEGNDLNHYMGKPMELRQGLNWMIQACRGLEAAHQRGVVHRDIKPHNIFVCNDGAIKVMDFGIAKRQESPGMTVGNMIAGTPDYMSPEQISGFSSVTHSTDVYAIGITAYQMFTGKLPFEHPELLPLLMKHLNEQPTPPRTIVPSLPENLEAVILKLIEKKAANRYQSCAEAAQAFDAVLKSLPR